MEATAQASKTEILEVKLKQMIENKTPIIIEKLTRAIEDSKNIEDFVVPTPKMKFLNNDGVISANIDVDTAEVSASFVNQLAAKHSIPTKYLRDLTTGIEPWKKELSVEIMNNHVLNERENVLVRKSNGKYKAFLSTKYKRFASHLLYNQFIDSVVAVGAEVINGYVGETKVFIEAVYPKIITINTEQHGVLPMLFGVRLKNSDFGDGKLEVQTYMVNCVCMNGLCVESKFSRVHLGGDISKNVELSNHTMMMDTKAHCSYLHDVISADLSMKNIEENILKIKGAASKEIDIIQEVKRLNKMGMSVAELDSLNNVFMLNKETDGVSGGNTAWKLINGITAVARDSSEERKVELEELASKFLA